MVNTYKFLSFLLLIVALIAARVHAQDVTSSNFSWGTFQSADIEKGRVIIDGKPYKISGNLQVLLGENPSVVGSLQALVEGVLIKYVVKTYDGLPQVVMIVRVSGT